MKFIYWFAGFFEDQRGAASSKRAALYVALFYLYLLIRASTEGKPVDQMVLFSVVGIIVAAMGLSTGEFFSNINENHKA
jgi:hypothetical protein